MKGEYRKCQKFICNHVKLNATESAQYVSTFIEDEDGLDIYDVNFLHFLQKHYEMERDYGNGEFAISLDVYHEYGIGDDWETVGGEVYPRGCDSPELKTAIHDRFFFYEESHRIKDW